MLKMMVNIVFLGLTAVCLAGSSPTSSPGDKGGDTTTNETGFVVRNIRIYGTRYRYQLYVPEDYTSRTNWPVILFLHGSGERGDDGLAPTKFVIGNVIKSHKSWFPCLVIFPQCRKDADWTNHHMDALVMGVLDQTIKDYAVDTRRIYLTGLSMGGCGVWSLAAKHPGKFAALVPVCGF
ncbi:MAG: alpha/beta hydrolase-fold protein, partial [Kiritimatiellia bacterium]|nr:alpha/beta hydrolase-fold protein [Kiritimatiellia bacterium]